MAEIGSLGLVPTSLSFDSDGNLLNLQVQTVTVQAVQEEDAKERQAIQRSPVSAIASLKAKHPTWDT